MDSFDFKFLYLKGGRSARDTSLYITLINGRKMGLLR